MSGDPSSSLVDITLPLARSKDEAAWRKVASRVLRIAPERIGPMRLLKHSIDARKPAIRVQLRLALSIDGAPLPELPDYHSAYRPVTSRAKRLLIIGCGPAGLFAALKAIELGIKPILLERGKDASARRFDLAPILRKGTVVEDSNYCFGEGGAGTFSDGKLYTRATKRGPVRDVYETLVAHGAPREILTDAHPHIGSNLLPKVVQALRQSILQAGGEVHFQAKVTDLLMASDGHSILGARTQTGEEYLAEATILATGHSARDMFALLDRLNIRLEQKPFAVGVRIEHPQPLIDQIQYHQTKGEKRDELLPAARYRLATKIEDRGVHSFCMCPGGFIVPAATQNDEIVVNGMSLARRDSPFANSGMVVTVEPEDTRPFSADHGVLAGVAYQRHLETAAKQAGGGGQVAPAQRLVDFLKGTSSSQLPKTSYFPGCHSVLLNEMLPAAVTSRLQSGLKLFGRQMNGYLTEEALLIGVETRTSSPVRIPRSETTLMHPEVNGLFPCAEGAGYAGGIVSAAMDGARCAAAAEAFLGASL